MLARYLRRVLACIAVCCAVLVLALWGISPAVALSSVLLAPVLLAATLALQSVAATWVNCRQLSPRATPRQLVFAWIQETAVAALVFFWWQPFRSFRYPDNCVRDNGVLPRRGVVLVHGFVCNRGLWNDWYPELDRQQIPYVAINLEPVFASIESYSRMLSGAVAQMEALTKQPPVLICHSMGGLVARNWLRTEGADAHVHRVITLGTPHRGTRVGDWMPHLPSIANAHQMRFDSDWLTELARDEPQSRRVKFVCFYSPCDNIVFPATSATLPGADNRYVTGVAHLALALDKDVRAQSLGLL